MTGHQRLALRLLDDADGMVDTHQMRLKLTIASGGRKEWTYSQTHSMLSRLCDGGFVTRHRPVNRTVSRWSITPRGRNRLEGLL